VPTRNKLSLFSGAILVLFVVVNAVVFLFHEMKDSTAPKKIKPPLRLSSFASGGSTRKLFHIQLDYLAAESDPNEIVEVTAKISVPFNYHFPVLYSWKLGPEVKLISGELSGNISEGISANQTVEVKIQVKGYTKTVNRHIWFEARSSTAGHALVSEMVGVSNMENTFENIVQNVERIKAQE
jgi:hypothetical protein